MAPVSGGRSGTDDVRCCRGARHKPAVGEGVSPGRRLGMWLGGHGSGAPDESPVRELRRMSAAARNPKQPPAAPARGPAFARRYPAASGCFRRLRTCSAWRDAVIGAARDIMHGGGPSAHAPPYQELGEGFAGLYKPRILAIRCL